MKKVLFIATITGFINSFQIPYLELFKEKKWETHIATGDDMKVNGYCDKKFKIQISRSPFKLNNIKAIFELKKIIDNEKYEIIHCHTPMGAVIARLAAKKARKKYKTRVIYTAHGFHFYKGAPKKNWIVFYPVEWYLAKYTDTLITINKEDYDFAKRKFNKRCKDIQYVSGVGIDLKKFDIKMSEKEKTDLRETLGLKKDDFVLTCVARLDKNKNQGFLIECMEELLKNNKNIHLLLAGRDELNGKYQQLVECKHLKNNIHFLGQREDIPQLLNISNVVISSSLREGLPVNAMEALATGNPVVALNCRGMNDIIKDKENGYLIEINDKKAFIKKLLELYNNKEIRKLISNNNKKKSKKYAVDNVVKIMNKIYCK